MDARSDPSIERPADRVVRGTAAVFLAEALVLPTGLVTAGFLTRTLGPDGYGLFTLAATVAAWVGWTLTSVFTRTTIKLVGDAGADWRPVADTVVWLHLVAGVGAGLLLAVLAEPLAGLLGERVLAGHLRLFALDVPLFTVAYAHRSILTGQGRFELRAQLSAGRWVARLVLVVAFVAGGLSVTGAILGSIGASLVELAVARVHVRPAFRRSAFPARRLADYAVPLFLFALALRLFEKLDLLALSALGGTAAQAGLYAAAQNLAFVPSLASLTLAPLLLATVSRRLHAGDAAGARAAGHSAMRLVATLLPFVGVAAGAAHELVRAVYGGTFAPAAPLLVLLLVASLALVFVSVATAILTAAGRPGWTLVVGGPLPLLALVGHAVLIPRLGPLGAASVTAAVSSLGAAAAVLALDRLWGVRPTLGTMARSTALAGAFYALSAAWPVSSLGLLVKLPLLALAVPIAFALLGEFSAAERANARKALGW